MNKVCRKSLLNKWPFFGDHWDFIRMWLQKILMTRHSSTKSFSLNSKLVLAIYIVAIKFKFLTIEKF